MLTGDLNVAEVAWIVQYRIIDPVKYLFGNRNPGAWRCAMSRKSSCARW